MTSTFLTAITGVAACSALIMLAPFRTGAHGQSQSVSAETVPLSVSSWIAQGEDGPKVLWTVTNSSAKPIVAYTLLFASPTDSQSCMMRNTIFGLGTAPAHDQISSGETLQERRGFPLASNQVTVQVSVDYVLFADGSSWGADTKKQSLAIQGVQEGWQRARNNLKALMDTKGLTAVIEDLRKDK